MPGMQTGLKTKPAGSPSEGPRRKNHLANYVIFRGAWLPDGSVKLRYPPQ